MKTFLFLIAVIYPSCAFSQLGGLSETSYYDDESHIVEDSTKCFYYSTPYSHAGVDTAYTYFCKSKSVRSMNVMKDGLPSGRFAEYYENGFLKQKGICEKGKPAGKSESWYRNGTKRSVIEYFSDEPYKMHHYWDSTGVQHVINGEGFCTGELEETPYDSIIQVGRIRHFRKDSTWVGFVGERNVFVEEYEGGVLIKGMSFDESGNTFSYSKTDEQAEMPGGLPKLYKFIGRYLKYPPAARRKRQAGTVFVSFVVGKNGILSDINVIKGVSPEIDKEAVRVVRLLPAWSPGLMRGQKVKSKFVLPIKFKLS